MFVPVMRLLNIAQAYTKESSLLMAKADINAPYENEQNKF